MNALVLVAHPDDEALFAGSLIASEPSWDWTLVALTAGPRAEQFPGTTLGFADEWRILTRAEYLRWRDAVREWGLDPDLVVTHNAMGEYGHPHHMAVSALARELFGKVWEFYTEVPSSVGPQAQRTETWRIPCDPDKQARFEATYPGVYDELRADKPELVEAVFASEWFTA